MAHFFIDIHSHIIPEVDDGAKNLETSVEMLKIAYKEGIHTIIATPHFYGNEKYSKQLVLEQLEKLRLEAKKIDPAYQILTGNEIYYDCARQENLDGNNAFMLADSHYILLEFAYQISYRFIYEKVRELILMGYIPILAHVERYESMRNMDYVQEIIELGGYIQVNADSLTGGIFNRTTTFCKKLLKNRWVHFVATDAHNTTTRRPELTRAVQVIKKIGGDDLVTKILYQNPTHILRNEYI